MRVHLFACHKGAPVPAKQRNGKSSRIYKHGWARPRHAHDNTYEKCKLKDVHAAAVPELEDARTAADARVLESELEHEHARLEEERKRTTVPEERLSFLELEVASSSTRGRKTALRLEDHVQVFIVDDQALMVGIIRFTQAHRMHDLLKNTERAQNVAQVRPLEEQFASSDGLYVPPFTSFSVRSYAFF